MAEVFDVLLKRQREVPQRLIELFGLDRQGLKSKSREHETAQDPMLHGDNPGDVYGRKGRKNAPVVRTSDDYSLQPHGGMRIRRGGNCLWPGNR